LAVAELEKGTSKVTVSRLSVMTGITRREIKLALSGEEPQQESHDFIRRVLGQWEQDEEFCNQAGKPKTLSFKAKNSEFETLVQKVSKDLSPPAVRKELERLGLVRVGRRGISIKRGDVPYTQDPDRTIDLFSRDIDSFVEAVEQNIYQNPAVRNAHLRTEYDNLFVEDLPRIRRWLLHETQIFHGKVREYLSKHDADINPSEGKQAGARAVLTAVSLTDVRGQEDSELAESESKK
jgi:hypothetical protein